MLGSGLSILRRGGLCLYFVLCVSLLLPQTISYCSFPSRGSPILFQASWRSIEPHRSTGSPSAYARDATSASTVALNETSSIEAAELVLERVQYTRSSLVKLIEESWKKVSRLVPASTLQLCETELNGAISLLVLATIRRSAEEFSSSRSLIEEMLREADSNHDGQLSYSEWYQWLRSGGSDDGGGGSLFAEMSMSSTTDTPADASLLGGRAGEDGGGESSSEQADPAYAGAPAAASVRLSIQPFSLSEQHATSAAQGTDPMVPALGLVLGHAVCTLKTVARMSQDPAVLSASFVAGGMAAGVLDESVCRRMLARLSPYARELVVHALSLESSSLTASSRESLGSCTAWLAPPTMRQARTAPAVPLRIGAVRPSGEGGGPPRPSASGRAFPVLAVDGGGGGDEYFTVAGTRDASRQADGSPLGGRQRLAAAGSGRGVGLGGVAQQGTTAPIKFGRRRQGSDGPAALGKARGPAGGTRAAAKTKAAGVDDDSIIMTVDLSSIPLLAAPSISDPVPDGAASIVGEGEDAMMDDSDPYDSEQSLTLRGESTVSAQGTITRDEGTVDFSEGAAGGLYSFGGTSSSAPEALGGAPLGAMQLYAQSKAVGASTEVLGGLLDRMAGIMQGAVELRDGLQDLDDAQAGQMRMLLLGNSHQRLDVLGLSMALRGARLQHANRQPMHIRHQLALETLQLWAPLSFQVGLSPFTPELEVHSYVHLFPRSFGSFVSWYSIFRPIARKLIRSFRRDLEEELRRDPLLPSVFAQVCIQSRLKTPPSAFKKMLTGAKVRSQLFDILGVRIIATLRQPSVASSSAGEASNAAGGSADEPQKDAQGGASAKDSHYRQSYDIFLTESSAIIDHEAGDQQPSGEPPGIESRPRKGAAVSELEAAGLYRVRELICRLQGWENDESRYKNYVQQPKPSGYQSLHLSLQHAESGINMEVQVRSDRMHWVAEYGSASHSNYKALLLPASTALSKK